MNVTNRETVAPATQSAPHRDRPFAFALAIGTIVLVIGGATQTIAWQGSAFRGGLLNVAALASIFLLIARSLIERAARDLLGVRGPVVAWRAISAGAVALALYDLYAFDYALNSSYSFFTWFSRFWELEPEAFAVPAVVAVAALVLAKRSVVARWRVRVEAVVALTLAVALLGAAAHRTKLRPSIHRYVTSLPTVGLIPSAENIGEWNPARADLSSSTFTDYVVGDVTVRRFVFTHRRQCALTLSRDPSRLPSTQSPRSDSLGDCESREVRHDARLGLHVLLRDTTWGYQSVEGFDRGHVEPITGARARMSNFRGAYTVAPSWIWTSALALAIALASIVHALYARRGLVGSHEWRQGTLRDDGMITVEGAEMPAPYGLQIKPGPVVLRAKMAPRGASPFRGGGATPDRDDVLAGSLSDVIAARESHIDASYAHSIAASLLASAPLLAAAVEGMLG